MPCAIVHRRLTLHSGRAGSGRVLAGLDRFARSVFRSGCALCHQQPHVLDRGINDPVGLAPGLRRGHFTSALADDRGQDRCVQPVERGVREAQQRVILADPLMSAAALDELEAGWPIASEEKQRQVTTLPAAFQEGACTGAEQLSSIGYPCEPRGCYCLAGGLLMSCLMLLEQCDEDFAFPAEVVIQAPDARSGALHDVGDARVGEALLGEDLAGSVEQRALRLGGAAPLPRAAECSASRWPGHLPSLAIRHHANESSLAIGRLPRRLIPGTIPELDSMRPK